MDNFIFIDDLSIAILSGPEHFLKEIGLLGNENVFKSVCQYFLQLFLRISGSLLLVNPLLKVFFYQFFNIVHFLSQLVDFGKFFVNLSLLENNLMLRQLFVWLDLRIFP